MDNNLIRFWAKTSHDHNAKKNAFHPLICHLIDVACVTYLMWQKVLPSATKERLARAFGLDPNDKSDLDKAGRLIAFIAGLHDLGKCSPPFQLRGKKDKDALANLVKQISEQADRTSDSFQRLNKKMQAIKLLELFKDKGFDILGGVPPAMDVPHGFVTTIELPAILRTEEFGFNKKTADQIGVLIGGHHGIFPDSTWRVNSGRSVEANIGNSNWQNARNELTGTLARLFAIKPARQTSDVKLDNGTIMILAGLVSVADWIGSDTQFFECAVEDSKAEKIEINCGSLENYLAHSEKQAETALEKLGWLNWADVEEPKEFFELFPDLRKFPMRALQTETINISKELKTAGIVVIESPMGEGKTEAAMFLADTWNTVLGQRGIYFALPTKATSNQMFGRVKEFLGQRFDKGIVNLQLLHGHSSLSAEFETLKDDFRKIQDVYEECSGDDCVPHVVASEWFTARKRGVLAPQGVGTIDQALMAVLQTKHVFVRLFGLAHKTIIIDEVHAYDAYMSTLLERLLEWLAALGSPVILLSATLPKNRRDALIKAYQKGLKAETRTVASVPDTEDIYPRISYATDATMKVRHINSSSKTQTLHIEKINEILDKQSDGSYQLDEDFAVNLKTKLEKSGGCVAIICNTVGRSQELYEQLAKIEFFQKNDEIDGLPILDLLHSRFRFHDRDEREKRVLKRFGKPDNNAENITDNQDGKDIDESVKRPKCAVLVATQIIEQSLDIDFDLMISDLAPIDLLLQRAGRLHRHDRKRQNQLDTPTLWIIGPPTDESGNLFPDKKGLPDFAAAGIIYDQHILLRTWLELRKLDQIKIPTEIENLVEAVYDLEKTYGDLSEDLKIFWQMSLEKCLKSISDVNDQAEDRYIKRPSYSLHISGIFANNLEEDSPEIHKSLQAMTRLTEPTATIICLWEKDGKVFTDESYTREIDLDKKPFLEQTKELLRNSLSISNKSVVFKFFEDAVPQGWQASALLRNHRVLKFDENRRCAKFGHVFCLGENLGLIISKLE